MSIDQQVRSFLDATSWSRVLCKDLQDLLVTWLYNDVHYKEICTINPGCGQCSEHNDLKFRCLLKHYPARPELVWAAAIHNPASVPKAPLRTPQTLYLAILSSPFLMLRIHWMGELTYEMCAFAVAADPVSLRFVPSEFVSFELLVGALQRDPLCLRFAPTNCRTKWICDLAYAKNPLTWSYIPQALQPGYPMPAAHEHAIYM